MICPECKNKMVDNIYSERSNIRRESQYGEVIGTIKGTFDCPNPRCGLTLFNKFEKNNDK